MALTADQRALLLSPTGEHSLAMVMGKTVKWVRAQRAALITPATDDKFGSVQRTAGMTLAEFEAGEEFSALQAKLEAAEERLLDPVEAERQDAIDADIADRRLDEIAQDPSQLVQGEALEAEIQEVLASDWKEHRLHGPVLFVPPTDDGVVDIEELIAIVAEPANLQAAYEEHYAAMEALIEESIVAKVRAMPHIQALVDEAMDLAVEQVAKMTAPDTMRLDARPGFAAGGIVSPERMMLVGEQPCETKMLMDGKEGRYPFIRPPSPSDHTTVDALRALGHGLPEIPASTLRFARWFADARWRIDSIAHLFDVDPRALAHALAAR